MASKQKLADAAVRLRRALAAIESVSSIGIAEEQGEPLLIIYLKRPARRTEELPSVWEDIPVKTAVLGKVLPAR